MSPCNLLENDETAQEIKLILSIRFDLMNAAHKDKCLNPFSYSVATIYKFTKDKDSGAKEAGHLV
jgi:hypothetical protein